MDTFIVKVCKGLVTNQKRDTSRIGYWIPVSSLPAHIAQRFGASKKDARPTLGFDISAKNWRDMKNAQVQDTMFATATVVTMDDGSKGIALLDF